MNASMVRVGSTTVVSAQGGVSLLRVGVATFKTGGLMIAGYAAAELGSAVLRQSLDKVDAFASEDKWKEGIVKALPGVVVTMLLTLLTYRSAAGRGGRIAGARAAAKVAVLMMVGVAASVLRRPVSQVVDDFVERVRTSMGGATARPTLSAQTAAALAQLPANVSRISATKGMAPRAAGDGDVMFFSSEGERPGGNRANPGLVSETAPVRVPRAGGDAGFTTPFIFDPRKLSTNETF